MSTKICSDSILIAEEFIDDATPENIGFDKINNRNEIGQMQLNIALPPQNSALERRCHSTGVETHHYDRPSWANLFFRSR